MFPPKVPIETLNAAFESGNYPGVKDLAPAVTYALLFSIGRFFLQNYLIKPVARSAMGLKDVPFTPIKDIDRNLPVGSDKIFSESTIAAYCKISNRSEESVKQYVQSRRKHGLNQKKTVKFVEAFWRCLFYTMFTVVGYRALFVPEPALWIKESIHNWQDWPNHTIPPMVLFYYQIELGCYFHQLCWSEVNRSDALEMIAHHIITISLITMSYLCNYWRVGSSILLLHDISDIFLEAAKVGNYVSKAPNRAWVKDRIVDPLFGVFAVTFFVTRLVLYPRYILWSVFTEGYETFGCAWGGCYFYVGLLLALQGLHVFWFYLIAKMIYTLAVYGTTDDVRSEADEEDEDEEKEGDDAEDKDSAGKGKKNN